MARKVYVDCIVHEDKVVKSVGPEYGTQSESRAGKPICLKMKADGL